MACNNITLSGIAKDCSNNAGGIKKIHIAPYDAVSVTPDENNNSVSISNTEAFKEFYVRRGSATMTSTFTKNIENGNSFCTTVLTYNSARMNPTSRLEMMALLAGEVAIVVEDMNGQKYYLGIDNPVEATNSNGQTGGAMTDSNAYSIELTDISLEYPPFVSQFGA